MQKILGYVKDNKKKVICTVVEIVILIAMLGLFYWSKGKNEYYLSMKDKLIIVVTSGLSVLLTILPNKMPKRVNCILSILVIIFFPVFAFYRLEPLINNISNCSSNAPIYNIIFILLILICVYGITANTGLSVAIGGGAIYAYYLTAYFTLQFRGTPLLFSDILSAKTAMGVAGNYTFVLNNRIVTTFYILFFLSSLSFAIEVEKKNLKIRLINAVVCLTIGICGILCSVFTDYLENKGFTTTPFLPKQCAQANGLLLNGIMSAHASILEKPEGYSREIVEGIIDNYSGFASEYPTSDVMPNIIVIMNESFTDIDYLETVKTSEDMLPKFKAMSENCIKGTLISSILGGNTPNSEFECLTGCSLAFLPTGMVAFQQLINSEVPSMASMLKNLGYTTTALHLYDPSYFDRQRVYPLLGIDTFISEANYSRDAVVVEYFKDEYAADWSTYKLIENEFESKKDEDKMFLFCVTIQNHGGYWGGLNDVKILGVDQGADYANEYLTLLNKSDDAFADLIEYFSNVDEPTLIVMYGDHQPYLFADDYVSIWDGYDYTDEQKRYMQAKVPFVIWANYDIEEADMGEMSIDYLGPTIMQAAGLPMSDYYAYLDKLRETIPVVSAVCFVDENNNHFYNYKNTQYADILTEYEFLQYNYLKDNIKKNFYGE